MALKELEVKYATKRDRDYKLADGGGLYVLIRPNGSKLWRMKYRFEGKEKMGTPINVLFGDEGGLTAGRDTSLAA